MDRKLGKLKLLVLGALLAPTVALADAPFCRPQYSVDNCFYYSAQACWDAAKSLGGTCMKNPNYGRQSGGVGGTRGTAPFCSTDSSGTLTQCIFYSADACRQYVRTTGGMCSINPNRQ